VFIDNKQLSKKFVETEVSSIFVPADGPASIEQIKKIRALLGEKYKFTKPLTNEELYFIVKMIDPKKQISQHQLDYNVVIPSLP
jgi:hypothetical protein